MGFHADLRSEILKAIVEDTPRKFWADLQAKAQWVYEESYDSCVNDPRIRPTQAYFKIISDKFFFFEAVLADIAEANGLVALPQEIKVNSWHFTLIRSGRITATAKYVYTSGHMGSPADFRKQLAAANTFNDAPQLALFGQPQPLSWKVANGIILHGPISRDFRSEGFRHLGFLHFALPKSDFSDWAANFTIVEILQAYESQVERRSAPDPKWKRIRKSDEDPQGAA